MPIFDRSTPIGNIQEGIWGIALPIGYVWEGTSSGYRLLWEAEQWLFTDDFERSSLGSNWSSSGGVLLNGGMLQKNDSAGSADNWTTQSFPSDDLQVRCKLGSVPDAVQVSSIVLGSPSQYVYCEFAPNGGQIGDYDGSRWTTRTTIPALSWAPGDTIEVRRNSTTVQVLRNGSVVATATSSVARGSTYRKVNLSVRCHASGVFRYKSPFFDDVKIRTYVP